MQDNDANAIRAVLLQVQKTTINVGNLRGHFLSEEQFATIIDRISGGFDYPSGYTPTHSESEYNFTDTSSLLAERASLTNKINSGKIALASAPKHLKSSINLEVQQLESRKNQIDKTLKSLQQ